MGMRLNNLLNSAAYLLLIIVGGCVEPYDPPVKNEDVRFLVVDAFLNSRDGSITANLFRTFPLYSTEPPPPELKASVMLEDDQGFSASLTETGNGAYNLNGLSVDLGKKYRLHIRTSDKEEYLSAFVAITTTPAIDSVFWLPGNDGVRVYVNTHDVTGKTRYYKWDNTETYEYTSSYSSALKLVKGEAVPRYENDYIYRCWRTIPSTNIHVGSSVKLQEDAIRNAQLAFLKKGSIKLSYRYSALVRQQAITEEAYNYWLQLEQTTESLGGLFDPMPTQITGNIYNTTNPDQPALGFFSGGTIEEKRIFIGFYDLPEDLQLFPRIFCEVDSIPVAQIRSYSDNTLLINSYGTFAIEGYTTADNICIDCRVQGGITTKPAFWP